MLRGLINGTLVSVVFCLLASAGYAEVSRKNIIIEILPCSDVVMSFKKFHPLIKYLKQQTGLDIEAVIPKDFEEFEWTTYVWEWI